MNSEQLKYLESEEGLEAWQSLLKYPRELLMPSQEFRLLQKLRRQYSPLQAAALVEIWQLRQKAQEKFPWSEKLLLDKAALEQATSWDLALHRAQCLDRLAPEGIVLEMGCGLGGDTLALARYRRVMACECDTLRLELARHNLSACGCRVAVWQEGTSGPDWMTTELRNCPQVVLVAGDFFDVWHNGTLNRIASWWGRAVNDSSAWAAFFADPARRSASTGRRLFALEDLEPPFSRLLELKRYFPLLCFKLGPGCDPQELLPYGDLEFVGKEGTCREAVLWCRQPRAEEMPSAGAVTGSRNRPGRLRASILYSGQWYERSSPQADRPPLGALEPGMYLFELDPCLLRAGCLDVLCRELGGWLFDAQVSWIMADKVQEHPLARGFRIEEVQPFSLKAIQASIVRLGMAGAEIKKRNFAMEPEELRKKLKFVKVSAQERAQHLKKVIFLTRVEGHPVFMIGERLIYNG